MRARSVEEASGYQYRVLGLPLAAIVVLASLGLYPRYSPAPGTGPHLRLWTAFLTLWLALLAHRAGPPPSTFAGVYPAQTALHPGLRPARGVYLHWGRYWPQVYDHAILILRSLKFAYAIDSLLTGRAGKK